MFQSHYLRYARKAPLGIEGISKHFLAVIADRGTRQIILYNRSTVIWIVEFGSRVEKERLLRKHISDHGPKVARPMIHESEEICPCANKREGVHSQC